MDSNKYMWHFCCYENQVKPLIAFSTYLGRSGIYIKNGELILHCGGSDFFYRVDYTVSNGELKKVRDMLYKREASDTYEYHYYINGSEITKEQWEDVSQTYSVENLDEIEFERIK